MFFHYRNLCCALQLVADVENSPPIAVDRDLAVEPPPPKKFTPQRKVKVLGKKIKKTPTKKTSREKK